MNTGDRVEIKEFAGSRWKWTGRLGHITKVDQYCYSVRTDDGDNIRDVHEHFRRPQS